MKHYRYKDYFKNIFPCLGYGLLCGSLVGFVIFFFKFFAKLLEENARFVYSYAKANPIVIPVLFIIILGAALVMNILHKKIPEVKGDKAHFEEQVSVYRSKYNIALGKGE